MKGFRFNRGAILGACAALAVVGAAGAIFAGKSPAAPSPLPATIPLSGGAQIYARWCGDCHSAPTGPGSLALQRKYKGDAPAVLLEREDLSPEFVKTVVRSGMSFMPSFRQTEISDSELDLLAAYLTSPEARSAAAKNKAAAGRKP